MAGAAAVLVTGLAWVTPEMFARGLVVGVGTTATGAAIALLTTQATGTAQLTAGSTAEQWTAHEQRKLRSHGWSIVNHFQLWDQDGASRADVVITMGRGDTCPYFPGTRYKDWMLTDPAGQPLAVVRGIRDDISVVLAQPVTRAD